MVLALTGRVLGATSRYPSGAQAVNCFFRIALLFPQMALALELSQPSRAMAQAPSPAGCSAFFAVHYLSNVLILKEWSPPSGRFAHGRRATGALPKRDDAQMARRALQEQYLRRYLGVGPYHVPYGRFDSSQLLPNEQAQSVLELADRLDDSARAAFLSEINELVADKWKLCSDSAEILYAQLLPLAKNMGLRPPPFFAFDQIPDYERIYNQGFPKGFSRLRQGFRAGSYAMLFVGKGEQLRSDLAALVAEIVRKYKQNAEAKTPAS
jgi:hypothetical protein